ncbi:MAG: class I SAM-dependent methyltransferase [Lachnospiraceae bacterium]|nr:class I SAM-dependent methyltransferase [Lachnospiraceae bacterium]
MQENKTLEYYNKNAESFVEGTVAVDFEQTQLRFISKLKVGDYILDFGCGSGRDTKYFLEKGFKVDAVDGSEELCKKASKITGIEVRQMLFQELNEVSKYNGIWACSSILHLPKSELKVVLRKMLIALKDHGVIYTSFKYGDFEGMRNGRHFTDFTLEALQEFIKEISGAAIEGSWITGDVRPGRGEEKWLNLLLRKTNF